MIARFLEFILFPGIWKKEKTYEFIPGNSDVSFQALLGLLQLFDQHGGKWTRVSEINLCFV